MDTESAAALKKHIQLIRQLLSGRLLGTLTEAAEDRLADDLEELWWKMTNEDQHRANAWLANQRAAANIPMKKPEGFCAKTKDVAEGGTEWRGKERKKKPIF
jgi:hypothetical protein